MNISDAQRDYWVKREKISEYATVEFYHPDFGSINLVENQFFNKTFKVNGVDTEFTAVRAEIPRQPQNDAGNAKAQIKFGRIGIQVIEKLRSIQDTFTPINANVRVYLDGSEEPTLEYKMFVDKQGVSLDRDNCTVTLSYLNPFNLQNQFYYSPSIFTGLQNL